MRFQAIFSAAFLLLLERSQRADSAPGPLSEPLKEYLKTVSCPDDINCDPNARCESTSSSYKCVCNPGFSGNGLVCDPLINQCLGDSDCGENAECTPSHGPMKFCRCKPDYFGDGFTCYTFERLEKTVGNCRYDLSKKLVCDCGPGFVNHGRGCILASSAHLSHQDYRYACHDCSPFATCIHSDNFTAECVCNLGYSGDGRVCQPMVSCSSDNDCPKMARCVATKNSASLFNKCECPEETVMANNHCIPKDKAPCNIFNNCHSDALCHHSEKGYKCRCKPGFMGDGKTCQKANIPCNVLNTCNRHAKCEYNVQELGYRCTCQAGYNGDGYSCHSIMSCRENPNQCHEDAACVYSPSSTVFTCQCNPGYAGDGYECSPTNHYEGSYLIYAHGMSLYRIPTQPGREGQLMISFWEKFPIGVDVDCLKSSLFYADIISKTISKSSLNGSNDIDVVSDLRSPEGVAVDWVGRNVYWTDSLERKIYVSKINGSWIRPLFFDNLVNPRGIVVHPGLGYMYWTEWNRNSPKIMMANMDGSNRRTLISDNLKLPNMLAIDYGRNELCWTDAGLKRIECSDLFGISRRLVQHVSGHPFGIAIVDEHIFWTDWETNKVFRVNRNGGLVEELKSPKGANGKLHGIVAMPTQCPPMSNPCGHRNGDCKYLCLPNGNRGRTCVCPEGVTDPSCDNIDGLLYPEVQVGGKVVEPALDMVKNTEPLH